MWLFLYYIFRFDTFIIIMHAPRVTSIDIFWRYVKAHKKQMEKRLRYPRVVSKQKRIRAIFHTHKRNPPHPMQHTEKGEKKIEEEIEIGSSKESDLNKGKKIEEDSFYAFIDSKERDCNWLQDEDATVRAFASCGVGHNCHLQGCDVLVVPAK